MALEKFSSYYFYKKLTRKDNLVTFYMKKLLQNIIQLIFL